MTMDELRLLLNDNNVDYELGDLVKTIERDGRDMREVIITVEEDEEVSNDL